MAEPDEPSEWRLLRRALPRRRIALLLLLVFVNSCVGLYWRGCLIGRARGSVDEAHWNKRKTLWIITQGSVTPEDEDLQSGKLVIFVPPTYWTDRELRETLCPWWLATPHSRRRARGSAS